MSDNSKIEWTDATWNPIIGCSKCSPGCAHCYAERMACRLSAMGKDGYNQVITNKQWNGSTTLIEKALDIPLKWNLPRKIFVCSMGDLFHETVLFPEIFDVMSVIYKCKQHTFILLTKRPQKMYEYFSSVKNFHGLPKNLWIGTTVCNQSEADTKIPILLKIPAAVRFVSIEPMLGSILLDNGETSWLTCKNENNDIKCCESFAVNGNHFHGIDWVICGGESGPGARPMHPDWVRLLKNQCEYANVPFLFKQWGEWAPYYKSYGDSTVAFLKNDGSFGNNDDYCNSRASSIKKIGKHKAGRLLDGKLYDQYPED
jgi:protein gp37